MTSRSGSANSSGQQYDYLFKYISVGDSGVGKSCLLLRFTNDEYLPTETTIGIEFGSKVLDLKRKRIKLQIWDTAGQESFRSISRAYYRGAIGCLLVYDVARRETFVHLMGWLDDVRQHGNEKIRTVLVANKADLSTNREVSREEGEAFAKKNGLLYVETSAKTGLNVKEAFVDLAGNIFDSLHLERDVAELSDLDIKQLEQNGVKVGPRRPAVVLSSPVRAPSSSGGCC